MRRIEITVERHSISRLVREPATCDSANPANAQAMPAKAPSPQKESHP